MRRSARAGRPPLPLCTRAWTAPVHGPSVPGRATYSAHGSQPPARPCRPSTRLLAVGLPQHPDEHGPERPILLAIDQELGEGPRLRVPPELPDRSTRSKSGSKQNVEQLGSGSRAERVEAFEAGARQAHHGARSSAWVKSRRNLMAGWVQASRSAGATGSPRCVLSDRRDEVTALAKPGKPILSVADPHYCSRPLRLMFRRSLHAGFCKCVDAFQDRTHLLLNGGPCEVSESLSAATGTLMKPRWIMWLIAPQSGRIP